MKGTLPKDQITSRLDSRMFHTIPPSTRGISSTRDSPEAQPPLPSPPKPLSLTVKGHVLNEPYVQGKVLCQGHEVQQLVFIQASHHHTVHLAKDKCVVRAVCKHAFMRVSSGAGHLVRTQPLALDTQCSRGERPLIFSAPPSNWEEVGARCNLAGSSGRYMARCHGPRVRKEGQGSARVTGPHLHRLVTQLDGFVDTLHNLVEACGEGGGEIQGPPPPPLLQGMARAAWNSFLPQVRQQASQAMQAKRQVPDSRWVYDMNLVCTKFRV